MLSNPRLYPTLLILVGVTSLASAYTAQFGFDLEPCILCLYQRVPFAVVIGLGVIGLIKPQWVPSLIGFALAAFAINSGIAIYHVGVEQHWWVSAAGCGADANLAQVNTTDLLASLNTKPPKPCDAVDWTFLGVSMASWNVVFSGTLALICAYVLKSRTWEA